MAITPNHTFTTLLLATLCVASSDAVSAQTQTLPAGFQPTAANVASNLAHKGPGPASIAQVRSQLDQGNTRPMLSVLIALGVQLQRTVVDAEDARTDKQLGARPSSAGTTSLVSKGGIPSVLALAVENGALTQSSSGTTITFQGTPLGVISALKGKGFTALLPTRDPALKLLGKLSFSASFDTSRGIAEGEDPELRADAQQLSQWTARAVIVNGRNPEHVRLREEWNKVSVQAGNLAAATQLTREPFESDPALLQWLNELAAAIVPVASDPAAIENILVDRASHFPASSLLPASELAFERVARDFAGVLAAREAALARAAEGLLITLEYTNDRPLNKPTLSNAQLIVELGGAVDLTGNLSFSWLNSDPADGTDRWRDVQLAGQVDVPFTRYSRLGTFTLSFAGRYQHLRVDPVAALLGSTATANIGHGQIKLTIPTGKGTGVKIPLSVSFSNRSELIQEKHIRGNIGVSYDLDALFAKAKP